ncbi:heavy-metal-associated domain-containing protein [Eubacterium xylanophilum]|uniref:heavy-metal-associated domain-containing protein n=1 Tax=Eubacterium xylanophilum TaxID=39497 RepID=UPI00047E33A5|nr:heavy metal-associated domain-containing protein [Eubacterium xylanophilum]
MGSFIIIVILLIIICAAIYSTVRRIRYGSSCCGSKEPAEKKVKVKDKNKDNYKYVYMLNVDGMHCSNCARRVENALNSREGIWAIANVGKKEVVVRSKSEKEDSELARIVDSAGYTMLSCKKI